MTQFSPAQIIAKDKQLNNQIEQWNREPLIAVDTESNSLHAYRARVCLIQLSTRTQDYIIDPFAIQDLSPFGELLANPSVEKIFHAAEYDLIMLMLDLGFEVVNLFDTMLAARVIGYEKMGLDKLLMQHFGVKVNKSHQKDDWGKRPLTKSSLKYAQMDTHFLPALRDILMDELVELGRLEEAREVFQDIPHGEIKAPEFDPDGFWHIASSYDLGRQELAVLRELYLLRDEIAEDRDRPPFKIFGNKVMIKMAQAQPETKQELTDIKGLSKHFVRYHHREVVEAIQRGRERKLPKKPHPPLPDPIVSERYTVLHNWRKTLAQSRGVESDVIIPKEILWQLAHHTPQSLDEMSSKTGMRAWRLQTYGDDLLDMMKSFKNGSK